MNNNNRPQPDRACRAPAPEPDRDAVELSELFLDDPPVRVQVRLVDDPEAIVHVTMHDLLTELLCEV